jgi:excisionase family DNA binding protein
LLAPVCLRKDSHVEIDLPDTISAATIQQAGTAVAMLRATLTDGGPPADLAPDALGALLAIMDAVMAAASEDNADLNPSEAAERLRVARPSVMRLIARGELSSRKDGGHYMLSPRELRSFQMRLASVRREALSDLTGMAEEFGF